MKNPNEDILRLIEEGESEYLDFKFEISDSKKIARSIVAFANTGGGKLLIGVKDNGKIAGIRSEEEIYMAEAATNLYSKPEVPFRTKEWHIEGKTILELTIPKSPKRPHYAPDKEGNWKVYVRVEDQNLLANIVLLKLWEKEKKQEQVTLQYDESVKTLVEYLSKQSSISLARFCKIASLKRWDAIHKLVDLLMIHVIEIHFSEQKVVYKLNPELGKNEVKNKLNP